jgi:hypothetical protein
MSCGSSQERQPATVSAIRSRTWSGGVAPGARLSGAAHAARSRRPRWPRPGSRRASSRPCRRAGRRRGHDLVRDRRRCGRRPRSAGRAGGRGRTPAGGAAPARGRPCRRPLGRGAAVRGGSPARCRGRAGLGERQRVDKAGGARLGEERRLDDQGTRQVAPLGLERPRGRIDQWPASGSRRPAKRAGLSKRGRQSQSTEPSRETERRRGAVGQQPVVGDRPPPARCLPVFRGRRVVGASIVPLGHGLLRPGRLDWGRVGRPPRLCATRVATPWQAAPPRTAHRERLAPDNHRAVAGGSMPAGISWLNEPRPPRVRRDRAHRQRTLRVGREVDVRVGPVAHREPLEPQDVRPGRGLDELYRAPSEVELVRPPELAAGHGCRVPRPGRGDPDRGRLGQLRPRPERREQVRPEGDHHRQGDHRPPRPRPAGGGGRPCATRGGTRASRPPRAPVAR